MNWKRTKAVKLNLGGGDVNIKGFTNIDRRTGQEVYPLGVEDNSVDEIRASHILEHFAMGDIAVVLKNWFAKLKPGGSIKIAVPDFTEIAQQYCSHIGNEQVEALTAGYVMGGQTDVNDFHKSVFNIRSLIYVMSEAGFIRIEPWSDDIKDCASLPVSLNLCGVKPTAEQLLPMKVEGIMSIGRLCFSQNMASTLKGFGELGIPFRCGQGVFWDQILSRMMEDAIKHGAEFIVTTDYDTYYQSGHLKRILQLMREYPEADAICPVQVKREESRVLIGKKCKKGQESLEVPITDLLKPLYPIDTGHFGLTALRVSALKKAKLPWFKGVPGPDNRWEENRQDPDIYFWNNWKRSGNSVYLATHVNVGHLQLLCTFPGTLYDQWKPTHVYINDLEKGGVPPHCRM